MRRSSQGGQGGSKRMRLDLNEKSSLGKVDSITLQNFMCHDNFTFQFGPQMNFIIGQNGSGKSAILTGLILALGGKSKVTGRFSNIKGFIKTGKQKAKIEVVLYNIGTFSYKPEKYGERISVVREFTVDGSNSYKLRSQAGKIVSSQKEELLNVLNAMDIQIENPIQIFTQETSRNFLVSKHATGENLYEIYFKGTGLQKLEEHYMEARNLKVEAFNELERKKQALPAMKEELKEWSRFLKSSKKVTDYKNELLWANIIEMEKKLEKKQQEYTKVEKDIQSKKEEIENCKKAIEAKGKGFEEYTKMIAKSQSVVTAQTEKVDKLNEDRNKCREELQKCKKQLDFHKHEQKKIGHEIENLRNRIKENQKKTQNDIEEEERRKKEQTIRLQKEIETLSLKLEDLKKQKEKRRNDNDEQPRKRDILMSEINSISYRKRSTEDNLNRAKVALKNKVNVFGEYTQRVLNEINARSAEFRKLPRGPIGMYVEVKDPNWIPAVEKCINQGLLCTYCVDNHQDQKVLKQILQRHCNRQKLPTIIVCQYSDTVYNVSQHKAQTDFPTVLDMLNIRDVQVANALIDHAKIENKILIEDSTTAQDLMLSSPPRNCNAAFLPNCDMICLHPYRYYSETQQRRNSLLSSVRQDNINRLQHSLQELNQQLREKDHERVQLEKYMTTMTSEEGKLDKLISSCSAQLKVNHGKLKDLEVVREAEDVDCLEDDLQSLKEDYAQKVAAIDTFQRELDKWASETGTMDEALAEEKRLLFEENEKYRQLRDQIQSLSYEKEVLTTGKQKFETEERNQGRQLETLHEELTNYKEHVEDATAQALSTSARINTTRERSEIERQLAETEKVVQNRSNCDRRELLEKYNEKLKVIKEAEMELSKKDSHIARLDEMLKTRLRTFKVISSNTRKMVQLSFATILSGNGYTGTCSFDVNNRTLKLEVAPKAGQSSRTNHSTLSGGERSYVALSFLLSLWEQTPMPFRVLDEYDVFMDSNNRQLSVDLLIEKAKEMSYCQFIFLSPLDLPAVNWPKDAVKIHKMIPPKRRDNDQRDDDT